MPDFFAPVIDFDGQSLAAGWQASLLEVRVEQQFQVPGRCTLRFEDWGYALANDITSLGREVSVTDSASSKVIFKGEVTAVAVEQGEGGIPELILTAHDKSHRLARSTVVKTYQKMMYSDVVSSLAADAGLTASTDSTNQTVDSLLQVDSSLGLLCELARRVGFDWWVDGTGTLNFKQPAAVATVSLTLMAGLRSFSVRASGQYLDSVTADGWDRTSQQSVTSGAKTAAASAVMATSTLAGLASGGKSKFGSAALTTAGVSAQNTGEAEAVAQALLDRAVAASVSARGVCDGNGAIVLGGAVTITDAGPLSGTYPVSGVEHTYRMRTGFVTKFRAGDRLPSTLVDTLGARSVQGPAHRHLGLTVATVTNNNDATNSGMCKLTYTGLPPTHESAWARILAVGAGKNRGAIFVPEVGDEVLVAFEDGDTRRPVVIGGLYGSKSTMPTDLVAGGAVSKRSLTSRLGHVISLLDGDADPQQAIELTLAGGQQLVHLGKDQLNIQVPSGTPVNIVAGSSSIKFDKQGDITVAGVKIVLQGTAEIDLKAPTINITADAQLTLQGQATAALKGAVVQVQGESAVTISGTPVAIN